MSRIAKNPENWTERMQALVEMNSVFTNMETSDTNVIGIDVWRTLKPLKNMIQDLRSQIVKEVCTLLSTMARTLRDTMVPFLREVLPPLMDVRGSGNKVCATYCGECIDTIVSFVVIRGSTLRFFIDTLLESKNKMIRLSCITVLHLVLKRWTEHALEKQDIQQIEKGLILALQDPSSTCRTQAYEMFSTFQPLFPDRAGLLLGSIDEHIQKRLESMLNGKDLNVSSESLEESMLGDEMELPYSIHDRVCIPDKQLYGFVRYIGKIDKVKGIWIGIELDEPYGKNDGSVKGKYYFHCEPQCGVFARSHQVSLPTELASVEAALHLELSDLQLSPKSGVVSSPLEESLNGLSTVVEQSSIIHRKYLHQLLKIVQTELEEHERFDAFRKTASSADVIQYLQQLQNAAQDKIVLGGTFIQHMIQAQQIARES